MKLWITQHHHRHGVDVYPCFQDNEPDEASIIQRIAEAGSLYEGPGSSVPEDDQDEYEWIECTGPWEIPS
jgi:hypothetical protein